MHTSRQAWDDACTKDLEETWKIYARLPSMATVIPTGAYSDETLLHMLLETRLICDLQRDLAKWASRRFAEDGFERRWKALAAGDRKNVVLEGIYRTMCLPDMEDRRNLCPDSTSEYLNSQNGDAFLRMLKEFLPGRHAVTSEPIHIPHPIVDRLLTLSPADEAKPGLQIAIRLYRLRRIYCLTTIVWNTFLAFYGEKETQLCAKAPKARLDAQQSPLERNVAKYHNALRKDCVYACWKCGTSEKILEPGHRLQACKLCYIVCLYICDSECQVEDWKNGVPVPHKQICGKPMNEVIHPSISSSIMMKVEENSSWIPKADAGYTRTPALLHQISLLRKGEDVDYYLLFPNSTGPGLRIGTRLAPFEKKIQFLVLRNRAFRNGDPEAVSNMFEALRVAKLKDYKSSPQDLLVVRKQLEAEYGATLVAPVPPVS
ncbi:hypothetical protein EW026_g6868 [Hermanssonia centrifuga]|uniref:MYND-type domain-containing protein n=1 Tax=Hermanssonia centrifuga TaxID=98765 RepID=A0A4S4KAL7_9APHY|nr:hypothetical protein EW026_g6868 [Hermanssonia centrifuga]